MSDEPQRPDADRASRGAIALVLPFYLAYQLSRAAVEAGARVIAAVGRWVRATLALLVRGVGRALTMAWSLLEPVIIAAGRLLRPVVIAVWRLLRPILIAIGRAITASVRLIVDLLTAAVHAVAGLARTIAPFIRAVMRPVASVVAAAIDQLARGFDAIRHAFRYAERLARLLVTTLWQPIRTALHGVVVAAARAWAIIEQAVAAVGRPIAALIRALLAAVGSAVAPLSRAVSAGVRAVSARIGELMKVVGRSKRAVDAVMRPAVVAIRVRLGMPASPPRPIPPARTAQAHRLPIERTDGAWIPQSSRRRLVATSSGITIPLLAAMLGTYAVFGAAVTPLLVLGVPAIGGVVGFAFARIRAGWLGWFGVLLGAAVVSLLAIPFSDQPASPFATGLWVSLALGLTLGYAIVAPVGRAKPIRRGAGARAGVIVSGD